MCELEERRSGLRQTELRKAQGRAHSVERCSTVTVYVKQDCVRLRGELTQSRDVPLLRFSLSRRHTKFGYFFSVLSLLFALFSLVTPHFSVASAFYPQKFLFGHSISNVTRSIIKLVYANTKM